MTSYRVSYMSYDEGKLCIQNPISRSMIQDDITNCTWNVTIKFYPKFPTSNCDSVSLVLYMYIIGIVHWTILYALTKYCSATHC